MPRSDGSFVFQYSKGQIKMPRPTLPRYLAKVPCPWWDLEGPPYRPTLDPRPERRSPPYHHTLDFRRQGRWGGGDYGTFQLQVSGRGGGGPESEVPMRFSSSALVRPSVTHGGTLRARRRPANGRRRSPAIIRTGSAQGTFQRSTLPPHLGPSAGEKVPPLPPYLGLSPPR